MCCQTQLDHYCILYLTAKEPSECGNHLGYDLSVSDHGSAPRAASGPKRVSIASPPETHFESTSTVHVSRASDLTLFVYITCDITAYDCYETMLHRTLYC